MVHPITLRPSNQCSMLTEVKCFICSHKVNKTLIFFRDLGIIRANNSCLITFTIYNKADRDLTIESIGFDSRLSTPISIPIGWDDSSIITGNVENVNKTIPANSSEVIRLIVKGNKRYEELDSGYTSSDEYPLYCIIDCHYGDNSSSCPYTGYLNSSSDADYTMNSYMTASASYRFGNTNTFHFAKTTDGDYVLATAN